MAEKEKKGMFSRLFGFLPFVGDDDEEITPEQQFIDHFAEFGTLLTDDRGQPTLKYEDAVQLFKSPTDKRYIQFLYSN